jgi:hypothetical protein
MEFEFVEFYPTVIDQKKKNKKKIIGTAHIYAHIPGTIFGMDIRGILVLKYNDKIRFRMPHRHEIDAETGEIARFPVVNFCNDEHQKNLMEFFNAKAVEEVEKAIKDRKITEKSVQIENIMAKKAPRSPMARL